MKNILLVILTFCSLGFTYIPPVEHCAHQNGERYYGLSGPGQACHTGFNNNEGIAYRFWVDQAYTFNDLEVSMTVVDNEPWQETSRHNISLYRETYRDEHQGGVPELNSLFFKSSFEVSENGEQYTFNGVKNTQVAFEPGQYWLAVDGGVGRTRVEPSLRFTNHEALASTHAPEPGTMALLGSSLLGLFGLKRKRKV